MDFVWLSAIVYGYTEREENLVKANRSQSVTACIKHHLDISLKTLNLSNFTNNFEDSYVINSDFGFLKAKMSKKKI